MSATHSYAKMCPRCRVPVLWLAEWDESWEGKAEVLPGTGERCRRCRRGKLEYMPVPAGCLHVWHVSGEPLDLLAPDGCLDARREVADG